MENSMLDGKRPMGVAGCAVGPSALWFTHLVGVTVSSPTAPKPITNLSKRHSSGLNASALSRVQFFLDEHIADDFVLDDLAQVACMSRCHFARMFRLSLKESPMRYVMKMRVALGQERLLSEKNKTVAVIASELGFCDQSHFTRSFRRLTGVTPGRFAVNGQAVRQVS